MRSLKILRIITRLNIGGPAVHAALLTEEFNGNGFETVLIYGAVSKDEGRMNYLVKESDSFYLPALRRTINPFRDFVAFCRIFGYVLKYRPDIVHTHTAKAGTLGRIAAILAGVPVKVHTFHGNIFYGYFNRFATAFFVLAEKILANFTNAVIAISKTQKREVTEKYRITRKEKCRIVRLGFDLRPFLKESAGKGFLRRKFNLNKDDILIGIIGRLTAVKNHRMFIDAARYLLEKARPDDAGRIRFVIIGGGELRGELLRHAEGLVCAKKIFFTGWIKEMPDVYDDLDIITLTSVNEGTPVSLIEAMASMRPVIATDVGGVKDAVGRVGILVKKGDYKSMADEMLGLVRSADKRLELGKRGREFAKSTYSKERLISDLKMLYNNLSLKKSKGKKR